MQTLAFVTNNEGKFKEVSALLDLPLEQVSIHTDEIQSLDPVAIVRHKALTAYEHVHIPLIVDDTSLHIKAWNGFPGPFIKHIVEAGGMELLLMMMQGTADRRADFVTTIGYYDGKVFQNVAGTTHGKIADEIIGGKSWGINGIFIPDGGDRVYGEMTLEEKNTLSHRAKAVHALKGILELRHPRT